MGKKSDEDGTGTDASIETQQFEQKRSQDVALTRTHNPDRLLPLGRGRCSRSPPSRGAQLARLPDGAGQGARPCGCSAGLPTAALRGTRLALRALATTIDPTLLRRDPLPPGSCLPRSGEGGALGTPAGPRLPPAETRCGRGRGGQHGRPFPLPKCQILCR